MNALLKLSRLIDAINERLGRWTSWLILAAVIVSAGNAVVRKSFDWSSNALLEIQWYLFSGIFLLSAGYTFLRNEHVRIDIIAGRFGPKGQNIIDVIGILLFLAPMCAMMLYLGVPYALNSINSGEASANAGGLILWPVKLLVPVGFFFLAIQAVSELIKRVAFLMGLIPNPLDKHKGPSAEEELAAAILAKAKGEAK